MEPTPVGLRACLSDVPPRGLRRQLTRARLALRGMGHPGFQVAQEAGTERRIRAPATHHLFRGSTRVHWPGSWMEASRQTGPFSSVGNEGAALPSNESPLASVRGSQRPRPFKITWAFHLHPLRCFSNCLAGAGTVVSRQQQEARYEVGPTWPLDELAKPGTIMMQKYNYGRPILYLYSSGDQTRKIAENSARMEWNDRWCASALLLFNPVR